MPTNGLFGFITNPIIFVTMLFSSLIVYLVIHFSLHGITYKRRFDSSYGSYLEKPKKKKSHRKNKF